MTVRQASVAAARLACDVDELVQEIVKAVPTESDCALLAMVAQHLRISVDALEAEVYDSRKLDQSHPRLGELLHRDDEVERHDRDADLRLAA
jgi:hypothetical protein